MSEGDFGVCGLCGRQVQVLDNGVLKRHVVSRLTMQLCPGGSRHPTLRDCFDQARAPGFMTTWGEESMRSP